jgi:hypothetical protein
MPKKIFMGLGIVGAVVGAGLLIGWLAIRGTSTSSPAIPPSTTITETTPTSAPPVSIHVPRPQPPPAPVTNNMVAPNVVQTNAHVVTTLPPAPTRAGTNQWEEKLDEILSSEVDDTNKVAQLFAMFPDLPADGKEEIVQHLTNLVEDEDYGALGKLLTDAKLPEEVLDALLSDLLNRPNATKLPLFLEIARSQQHPKAEEAKELLELYLEEEYGNDWAKWQQKMQEWLKENPD